MKIKILCLGSILAICFSLSGCATSGDVKAWNHSTITTASFHEPADAPIKLLHLTANVDGSGKFIFTGRNVRYENKNWSPPTNVTIDGKSWDNLGRPFPGWKKSGKELDLSRAWIVEREGRDVIALEQTPGGFDLYLCDSPNGSATYEVTIAIPRKD